MKIAVISDLHLGPGDESDLFGHDDGRFLKFLSFLEDNFERIVLLGDIWETLTTPWPLKPGEALQAARRAHPQIAERFERPAYTYVHGNHDIVAGTLERVPEELTLCTDGTRLLFTHGHQSDALIRRARRVSELGIWLGGWVLRLGMRQLYRLLDQFDRLRSGAVEDGARCTFQRWAVSLARTRNADIIVTGHTHIAVRAEHGDRLYLNSGSCSGGKLSFLAIDTRRGVYQAHAA
jgi:predicted phosphodiesterase